jgi:hypothetical protein
MESKNKLRKAQRKIRHAQQNAFLSAPVPSVVYRNHPTPDNPSPEWQSIPIPTFVATIERDTPPVCQKITDIYLTLRSTDRERSGAGMSRSKGQELMNQLTKEKTFLENTHNAAVDLLKRFEITPSDGSPELIARIKTLLHMICDSLYDCDDFEECIQKRNENRQLMTHINNERNLDVKEKLIEEFFQDTLMQDPLDAEITAALCTKPNRLELPNFKLAFEKARVIHERIPT